MKLGIILVHGFSGNYKDLTHLYNLLCHEYDKDSLINIKLPLHENIKSLKFESDLYTETVNAEAEKLLKENREMIIIGHSTGGALILSAIKEYNLSPSAVILIGTPYKVDINYLKRWEKHANEEFDINFTETAKMISFINKTCQFFDSRIPLIILNGENDDLVLKDNLKQWSNHKYSGELATYLIPEETHHINKKTSVNLVAEVIRNIIDHMFLSNKNDLLYKLFKAENSIENFIKNNPVSAFHLLNSPAYKQFDKKEISLNHFCINDPVIANIEITTHCNLKCRFCYRTQNPTLSQNMPVEDFNHILQLLPNCYKITLVGHGEPLMHPKIAKIVKIASDMHRKVVLVTNGMLLNEKLSEQLIDAGLSSITFSIDYFDRSSAESLRSGTDFDTVKTNIKNFIHLNKDKKVTIAVFSAVSSLNINHLDKLIDLLSELGINILMLTDLNFIENQKDSLSENLTKEQIKKLRQSIKYGFSKQIIILTVRALESFGIQQNYTDHLLIPPDQLYKRSEKRTFCFSPWQTIPVNVNGDVSICDCKPDRIIGNIFRDSPAQIWNGKMMADFRRKMLSDKPENSCKVCPRF